MGSRLPRLRVLLIDDHADTRDMYDAYLGGAGMDVRAAADGETGLNLALEWRPDVVVCDWAMPGMTGEEVSRRMKSDPRTQGIPVVILTAFGLHQRPELKAAGAAEVCAKPCAPRDLADLVKQVAAVPSGAKAHGRHGTKRIRGPKRDSAVSIAGRNGH
jgi:two-component system, OmpR family, phosphate regulon response regulator PhoB